MACIFNPEFWKYVIILIAGIMIIRILVPWIIAFFELPAPAAQVIMIILWAVIAIAGVYLLFQVISCFGNGGGLSFPTLPHGR